VFLSLWLAFRQDPLPSSWVYLDIGLAVFFLLEFFTRSGFRRNPASYVRTRFFDFIALIPVLALVNRGFPAEGAWVWLVLAARLIRFVDRLLGDGFVGRNIFALIDGFEEEITDRVTLRFISRLEEDMQRGRFTGNLAEVFQRNRAGILARIKAQNPSTGVLAGVARLTGLDTFLERTEERTYDAVVEILKSHEVETAVNESLASVFSTMRKEIAVKSWKQNLGFRRRRTLSPSSKYRI